MRCAPLPSLLLPISSITLAVGLGACTVERQFEARPDDAFEDRVDGDDISLGCLEALADKLEDRIATVDKVLGVLTDGAIDVSSAGADDIAAKMSAQVVKYQAQRTALHNALNKVLQVISSRGMQCVLGACGTWFSMAGTADAAEWTWEDSVDLVLAAIDEYLPLLDQRTALLAQLSLATDPTQIAQLEQQLAVLEQQIENLSDGIHHDLDRLGLDEYLDALSRIEESFALFDTACVPLSCLSFCADPTRDDPVVFGTVPVVATFDGASHMLGSQSTGLNPVDYAGTTIWTGEVTVNECRDPGYLGGGHPTYGDHAVLSCQYLGGEDVRWHFETTGYPVGGHDFIKTGCDYSMFTSELNAEVGPLEEFSTYAACDTGTGIHNGPVQFDLQLSTPVKLGGGCEGTSACDDTCAGASTCTSCPADFDATGEVDFGDFLQFNSMLGQSGAGLAEDLDSNGTVDFSDFLIFGQRMGPCPGA